MRSNAPRIALTTQLTDLPHAFRQGAAPAGRLTVKLRGRTTTPDERRGRTLSTGARGAKQEAHHGPLQRLLDGPRRLVGPITIAFPMAPVMSVMSLGIRTTIATDPTVPTGKPVALAPFARKKEGRKREEQEAHDDADTFEHVARPSNGEVEVPDDHAGQATRAHNLSRGPRRQTDHASRPPPTIVRGQPTKEPHQQWEYGNEFEASEGHVETPWSVKAGKRATVKVLDERWNYGHHK